MKPALFVALLLCALGLLAIAWAGGANPGEQEAVSSQAMQTWRYPIAPGLWYPGNGKLPEKPVRYYRARCWPGCHRGSDYGLYPDEELGMKPIFPTSTIRGGRS